MEQINMQFTLEEHFEELSKKYEQVKEVYCLWTLLKKDISEKLGSVYRVFPYFSRHDASHSRTIITNIELFLGEDRIRELSATDTFMLLICAYTHDYGMALELEEVLGILSDSNGKFKKYLKSHVDGNKAAERLMKYYSRESSDGNLRELYYSLVLILQDYNRPEHWKGVEKIKFDYDNIFLGRIKARFINSIISICETHGKNVEEIENLSSYSNGMFADMFHPRFIAAMIRLGDLLDLDNNRFSKEFELALCKKDNSIPELSRIHYLKHESITHFFVGPTHIDIEASCNGNNALLVARELYEWLHWLENDCSYLKCEWDMIAQRDFGAAPRIRNKKILVDGIEYQHFIYNLRMELPSDKIFDLLAGSNVYDNKYVAFREIIQNAIDATLLQSWKDFYNSVSPEALNNDCSKKLAIWCSSDKFKNDYKIQVNVIEDECNNSVYVEVIDNGIGIDDEDLQYMCRIGENNICNPKRHQLINQMPDWFVPAGVFGIGLQSAFQLTDEIEFFTKKANRTPRHIRFSSYSSNKGKIEVSKCPNTYKTQFRKLSTQGTLVRLKINHQIFNRNEDFDYFDLDFDQNKINNHVIYVEIKKQLERYFQTNTLNYFPIILSEYKICNNEVVDYENHQKTFADSDFYGVLQSNDDIMYKRGKTLKLYYWDENNKIFLTIIIPKCKVNNKSEKKVSFMCFDNTFSVEYKYNIVSDYRQLFGISCDEPYSRIFELNNNIINCFVAIFDKNPERYLNINRTVLKFDGIKYSDIVACEKRMFTEFCKLMINKSISGCNSLEFFPILSLLFARFADEKVLEMFENNYKNELESITINSSLNQDGLKLSVFFGRDKSFTVYDEIDDEANEYDFVKDSEECYKNAINIERLYEYFPKHFFVPISMNVQKLNQKSCVIYCCKIRHESSIEYTGVDEKCWKLDCMELSKDWNQLVKKALKPISKYKIICVNKLPKTFKKSCVFKNVLDNNISSYILSPFNDKSAKKIFECKKCKSEDLESHIEQIKAIMNSDIHFNKCVKFVMTNHEGDITEGKIRDEYFKLIIEMAEFFNTYAE